MSSELKLAIIVAAGHLALIRHKTSGSFGEELKSNLIDLEAKGWLVKVEGSKDLQITPAGEVVLDAVLEVMYAHLSN